LNFRNYIVKLFEEIRESLLSSMNLFSFLKRGQFRPAWQYRVKGSVWQVQTGSPKYLVGEDRDIEGRKATFFCLDRATGKPAWEWLNPGDPWWTGIEVVEGAIALFHGFASPDFPIHRGLTAVDLGSGETLWSNPDVRFLTFRLPSILVLKETPERRVCLELSMSTGSILNEYSNDDIGIPSGIASAHPRSFEAEVPRPFRNEDYPQSEFFQAIRKEIPANVMDGSVFGLLSNGLCVVSYCIATSGHSRVAPEVCSVLRVLRQRDAVLLYADRTNDGAAALTSEPFFVQNSVLYYVRQRSTLVAVPIRAA
jgi:hypothetical protein